MFAAVGSGPGAEQVALGPGHTECPQRVHLPLGLDSLGHDPKAEHLGEIHHGADDADADAVVLEPGHEGLVDLERVGGQLLEVGQSGVPGPEVVQRDVHAQVPQPLHVVDVLARVQRPVLGDLDPQPVR